MHIRLEVGKPTPRDLIDPNSGEFILEEGDTVTRETMERVAALREDFLEYQVTFTEV